MSLFGISFLTSFPVLSEAIQNDSSQAQIELRKLIDNVPDEKIARVAIFYNHIDADSSILVTPEYLELTAFYKLQIKLRGTIYSQSFARALAATRIQSTNAPVSLKWGVVLYNWKDQRLGAIYFDQTGEKGIVNNLPVAFMQDSGFFGLKKHPRLFEWLTSNFSDVFK